jgi:hypothetical protein
MLFNKNPCRDDDKGLKASLTLRYAGTPVISFALVTVAGPARTIDHEDFSSCSSENHSARGNGQLSHRLSALWTGRPALTLSLHSFYYSVVREFIAGFKLPVKNDFKKNDF